MKKIRQENAIRIEPHQDNTNTKKGSYVSSADGKQLALREWDERGDSHAQKLDRKLN
jgi:hypothetical protein